MSGEYSFNGLRSCRTTEYYGIIYELLNPPAVSQIPTRRPLIFENPVKASLPVPPIQITLAPLTPP